MGICVCGVVFGGGGGRGGVDLLFFIAWCYVCVSQDNDDDDDDPSDDDGRSGGRGGKTSLFADAETFSQIIENSGKSNVCVFLFLSPWSLLPSPHACLRVWLSQVNAKPLPWEEKSSSNGKRARGASTGKGRNVRRKKGGRR